METIKIPTASLLLWPGNFLATSLSLLAMTLSCRCIKKYFPKVYFLTYWVACKGSWLIHLMAVNRHISSSYLTHFHCNIHLQLAKKLHGPHYQQEATLPPSEKKYASQMRQHIQMLTGSESVKFMAEGRSGHCKK